MAALAGGVGTLRVRDLQQKSDGLA